MSHADATHVSVSTLIRRPKSPQPLDKTLSLEHGTSQVLVQGLTDEEATAAIAAIGPIIDVLGIGEDDISVVEDTVDSKFKPGYFIAITDNKNTLGLFSLNPETDRSCLSCDIGAAAALVLVTVRGNAVFELAGRVGSAVRYSAVGAAADLDAALTAYVAAISQELATLLPDPDAESQLEKSTAELQI